MKQKFTSKTEYIEAIAPAAVAACKKYGYLPSVLIAQSCLENGYGIPDYWDNPEIANLLKYNNMIGMKAELLTSSWDNKSVWPGKAFSKNTPEEYDGMKVTTKDSFRIYDSIEQSFEDYLLFLTYASNYGKGGTPKYGREVLDIKDPATLISEVNRRGYATDSSYSKSVMRIVEDQKLTKYDSASSKGDKVSYTIKKGPSYNKGVAKRGNEHQYIAVHYLGVDGQNNELWGSGYGAHYVIFWDGTIYQTCDHDAVTWQVGTAHGVYKQKHPYANNYNTIGIEMCCHNTDGYCPETPTGEKHWYFTEATQRAAVWLVQRLMRELKLDISHVLRHFDVVNKTCPAPYVYNNRYKGTWTWDEFLAKVKGGSVEPVDPVEPEVDKCHYKVRKSANDEASQIEADEILDNAKKTADKNYGYKVFDSNQNWKCVYDPFRWHFLDQMDKTFATGRKEKWTYGDSHSKQPCKDKKCSCDRSIARALYDLGFTDQRIGGEVCNTLESYLCSHGWTKVTDKAKIVPGSVIAVIDKGSSGIDHVFTIVSYDAKTDTCIKYDSGSTQRIRSAAPTGPVKLLEWGPNRTFVAAYNPPNESKSVVHEEFFRVRKVADDESTQIGAYKNLKLAIETVESHAGYSLYDPDMKVIRGATGSGKKYRVQVGIFSMQDNAMNKIRETRSATGYNCQVFLTSTDEFQVCCGLYKTKKNAEKRAAALHKKGIPYIIVAMKK